MRKTACRLMDELSAIGLSTDHTSGAPDIGGRAVASANKYFKTAVLPGLDVLCEMVVLKQPLHAHFTTSLSH